MSFCSETKEQLCEQKIKSHCCKKALLYGLLYAQSDFSTGKLRFSTDLESVSHLFSAMYKSVFQTTPQMIEKEKFSRRQELQKVYKFVPDSELNTDVFGDRTSVFNKELLTCQNCAGHFLEGVFLASGTLNNPKSSYHLELAISNDAKCYRLLDFLTNDLGFSARRTVRRGVGAIYIKESAVIEDFMTMIGAPGVSLNIMNVKIMRDIRNNENRRTNCDAANIYKSTGAASQQLKAIRKLEAAGKLEGLPEQLRVSANLRLENPELSLEELAALHEPAITKSGLSHRMKKLAELSESL